MSKRFSAYCLFVAWLCASGGVLNGVQVYAWGRMFMAYSHQLPVVQAAVETMDGSKPCPVCLALRRVREQSQQQVPPAAPGTNVAKLLLIAEEPMAIVFTREREPWPAAVVVRPPNRVEPVRLQPPRAGAERWAA